MSLIVHEPFIERVRNRLIPDQRFVGLLAGGSMVTGEVDEFSDLDFVVVYDAAYKEDIMKERLAFAESVGGLLAGFTGEHVGEPRLLICLYGPVPLHVDFKFVTPEELSVRIEDPLILWERKPGLRSLLQGTACRPPSLDPQWIEDRFWIWVHYGAAKLGRGELFELIDHLTYMRSAVLGPWLLAQNGQLPRGVRMLEQRVPEAIEALAQTVPVHEAGSCGNALRATIRLYRELREQANGLTRRAEAEQAAVSYLEQIYPG